MTQSVPSNMRSLTKSQPIHHTVDQSADGSDNGRLSRAQSVNRSNGQLVNQSTSQSNKKVDIFGLLHWLHTQSKTPVRDYLVHRLYSASVADIDFVLPQLIALMLSWDRSTRYRLSEFLINQSSRSVHLSLKILWICEAHEYYASVNQPIEQSINQTTRIREFIQAIEMSLVNGDLFGSSIHSTDGFDQSINQLEAIREKKKQLRMANMKYYVQKKLLNQSNNQSNNQSIDQSNNQGGVSVNVSLGPHQRSQSRQVQTEEFSTKIFSPVHNQSNDQTPRGVIQPFSYEDQTNDAMSPKSVSLSIDPSELQTSQSDNQSNNQSNNQTINLTMPMSTEDVFFALSKSIKCEYFQRELRMIHELIEVSTKLVQIPHKERNSALKELLESFLDEDDQSTNQSNSQSDLHSTSWNSDRHFSFRGLYFPSNEPNQSHYRILRILPSECRALNSRDKAPFLMFFEVERMRDQSNKSACNQSDDQSSSPTNNRPIQYKNAHDYDIFNAFRSRESILDDAIRIEEKALKRCEQSISPSHDSNNLSDNHSNNSSDDQCSNNDTVAAINERTRAKQSSSLNEQMADLDELIEQRTKVSNKIKQKINSAMHKTTHPGALIAEAGQVVVDAGQAVAEVTQTIGEEIVEKVDETLSDEESRDGSPVPISDDLIADTERLSLHSDSYHETSSSVQSPPEPPVIGSASQPNPPSVLSTFDDSTEPLDINHDEREADNSSSNDQSNSVESFGQMRFRSKSQSRTTRDDESSHDRARREHRGHSSTVDSSTNQFRSNVQSSNQSNDNPRSPIHRSRSGSLVRSPRHSRQSSSSSLDHTPSTRLDCSLDAIECDLSFMDTQQWKKFDAVFGDRWTDRRKRIRATSIDAHLPDWDLQAIMFKNGDDCRQEVLAMQLIRWFDSIFQRASLPLWLKSYSVLICAPQSGLIEVIHDATSIDGLKKGAQAIDPEFTLAKFFHAYFGMQGHKRHRRATLNFVESLAAYSVVTFLLSIKDRHNGNIMLDRDGHIIHIDFGFMLSNSPGRNFNWESAPFKLTSEFIEVMGGLGSDRSNTQSSNQSSKSLFPYYRRLVVAAFMEARRHSHVILLLIQLMMKVSRMPCFSGAGELGTILQLRQRLKVDASDAEAIKYAHSLIDQSIDNWRTRKYDSFQKYSNGII